MIVRTYGRRKSCITRSYSDSSFNGDGGDDSFSFRDSLSQESSQEIYNVPFSSQDSSPWTFDSEIHGSNSSQNSFALLPPRPPSLIDSASQGEGDFRKPKKPRKNLTRELKEIGNVKSSISKRSRSNSMPATSTLMEAQEFGEMMEHVDEVNFALDGLRKGQPSRIRRASLLALLSICATATQRRLLRTQGMAKTIIDAVLDLSFDDSPSTLAAATLFYILASDGQDDHLLDSPICIRFLLNLLSPSIPVSTEDKAPSIGCKLLTSHRNFGILRERTKKLDASSTAIISKVQDILLSCKEIEPSNRDDDGMGRPELSPKWIALLTMEKACLSTVSLQDTSGTVRRDGGSFKERLRELGGLDAVFDVARSCHSIMEGWSENTLPSIRELKDDMALQTVVLLLKSLKIMENATFLSKDNQNHLLRMNGKSDCEGSPVSFINLMISVIKILSGLSLLQSSSFSGDDKSHFLSDGNGHASEFLSKEENKVDRDGILSSSSSGRCCRMEKASHVDSFKVSQKHHRLSSSQSTYSVSSSETTSGSCNGSSRSSNGGLGVKINGLKLNAGLSKRPSVTKTIECINLDDSQDPFAFDGLNGGVDVKSNGLKLKAGLTKRPSVTENIECINLDDSQDPFAFDEDEFEPSKWDALSRKKEVPRTQKNRVRVREFEDECEPLLITSHPEPSKEENCNSCEIMDSPTVEEENPNLLADCLLTAVKVLMNLTNDNSVGCQQIGECEGLETLSTLIVGHFPSFSSCIYSCKQTKETIVPSKRSPKLEFQKDRHLTDQELDFLVAILGLLVNLVEKDSRNRSRLAAATVSLPTLGGSEETESRRDVIPLLCSIFLANQGAGEAAEDGRLQWSDEAAVLQGEHEAEKMIIEAYAALVLAFLSTESKNVREAIASYLPDHNLEILVPVLERFVVMVDKWRVCEPTDRVVQRSVVMIFSCFFSGVPSDVKHDFTGNPYCCERSNRILQGELESTESHYNPTYILGFVFSSVLADNFLYFHEILSGDEVATTL
ncbi:Wings apart-like protein [Macleaya cordata]|uniref:Wings apart-like protein n=1 Tax=Macleaya cordata TaxID=56857 RepID=A0A200QRY5_MACCD|nr:Wings apart-like protein [Macleaya cordata]